MFTTESALVKLWAKYVENGTYTREQVPKLSNLQEMVYAVLDAEDAA
ncbi:hypothetical protein [Robertmurraya siralis]|nr:hypothetical protein [Robertmurraya siralis]